MPRFSFGTLAVPDNWDVHLQLELREPARAFTTPTIQTTLPPPPANIVVRRGVSDLSAGSCADALLSELRASATTVRAQDPAEVVFEDGAAGVELELSFAASPQLTVVQRHVFRMDAGVVTHLCATAHDARALVPLGPLLLSFTP